MQFDTSIFSVLIVDDNPKNLQVLGNILKNEGYKIEFAMNGIQALKRIYSSNFDIILLDVMMPDMNGTEVCQELRKQSKYDNTPVIFLTAKSEKQDILEGFKLGAQDYILKPFDTEELLARVSTQLELKYRREQLAKANQELAELNSTKDLFFSIIAHDLKSPFFVLTTYSEQLFKMLDQETGDKFREIVIALNKASKQGKGLLNNLLHWAMAQTGKLENFPETIATKELMKKVINLVKANADLKSISLVADVPDNLMVKADRNMLETVALNLLSNAIKFTSMGGQVVVVAKKNGSYAQIEISDNGVGISEDNLVKIFRIDQKHKSAGTSGEEGSGLGLIVCLEFVKKNGGEINVTSREGEGTTFTFTVPIT